MEGSSIIYLIIVILNVILFFKIWQATNDVRTIKNHLLGEPIKKTNRSIYKRCFNFFGYFFNIRCCCFNSKVWN